MNLTFGFIAFFISIIIPGILFRRYYYYGEFSKQFHTKDPVLHSIFLSIVPGVCLQLAGFYLLSKIPYFEIENIKIFNVFKDFAYLESNKIGADTIDFLNNGLGKFILYSLIIFLASALIGNLSSRLIRAFKLDRKDKIFRFRNQWYYVFSGEVLNFQKFKLAKNLKFNSIPENQKVLLTFADVLVANSEGNRELYTGYVVDYDLNHEDISKLDKIYLLDAYRYKKPNGSAYTTSDVFSNIDSTNQHYEFIKIDTHTNISSRKRIGIPGDMLIVSGQNILNINLTYVPSKEKEEHHEASKQRRYKVLAYALTTITLAFILLHLFSSFIDFKNYTVVNTYFEKSTFWGKLFTIILFNQIIGLGFPVKDKSGKYYFSKNTTIAKIFILVVLSFIFYSLIAKQSICISQF